MGQLRNGERLIQTSKTILGVQKTYQQSKGDPI